MSLDGPRHAAGTRPRPLPAWCAVSPSTSAPASFRSSRATGSTRRGDLVDVVVAEDDGHLLGACLGLMTFSTWRGARGLYVVDLFVLPQARGTQYRP